MIEFFAGIGLLWSIIFIAEFLLIMGLVGFEKWGWSTVLMIGTLVAVHYFLPDLSLYTAVVANPWLYVALTIYYLIVGVMWSLVKWYFFLVADLEKKEKSGFRINEAPKATHHSDRIVGWMCFWPFSMIGTLLNDPIRKFFLFVFRKLQGVYDTISEAIFRKAVEKYKQEQGEKYPEPKQKGRK